MEIIKTYKVALLFLLFTGLEFPGLTQAQSETHVWSETYTNYGGTNWGMNEPIIGIGEGFVLFSSTNQTWVQTFSPCPGN